MLKIILILLLFSLWCQQILSIEKKGRSLKKWKKCIKVYCLPNDYNKLTVPFNESGQLEVTIDLNISQVHQWFSTFDFWCARSLFICFFLILDQPHLSYFTKLLDQAQFTPSSFRHVTLEPFKLIPLIHSDRSLIP